MKKRQSRKQPCEKPREQARAMTDFSSEQADPLGSYTGCPADSLEQPVQDADDL